jgi:hypothetical protein
MPFELHLGGNKHVQGRQPEQGCRSLGIKSEVTMIKKLFVVSAVIEITTGIILLAAPALVVSILLGGLLDTAAGLATARVAGVALVSFGVACWSGSLDTQSRAASGIVVAMLVYNISIVVLLLSLRFGAGMTGAGLLPVSVLHAALAVWCIAMARQ